MEWSLDELIKQSPRLAVCCSEPTSPAPQQAAEHADYQWERIMGPIRTTGFRHKTLSYVKRELDDIILVSNMIVSKSVHIKL